MPKNAQTNSQQVYEKMLNITLHQENGNQHQNEVSPHTHLNNIIKKKNQISGVGENVEQFEFLYTTGGNL